MPEISRFYGIIIKIYFQDHNPPHFHAYYSGSAAIINIETGEVMAGYLPIKARLLVEEWRIIRHSEIISCWNSIFSEGRYEKIRGLD